MTSEPLPQVLVDCALGFIASVLTRRMWLRVIACLLIPFVVSFIALGPENFSSSTAVEATGLFYTVFAFYVLLGLAASAFGALLGYVVRLALKLRT